MQATATSRDIVLQGEYRLTAPLGSASHVFVAERAHDPRRYVARLYRPSYEALHSAQARATFERARERMQAAAGLRHPMLAAIKASGQLEDGTLFVVSEHADGVPLDAWVDAAGIAPWSSVVGLLGRLCSALDAAHREGLAHPELHPASVLVLEDGDGVMHLQGKLVELGVPTCMFDAPPSLRAARFMAPEQLALALRPATERPEPTPRMNVYSCGALLYALCTGGAPFSSRTLVELMEAHAGRAPAAPSRINPQVTPELDAIVLKALAREPSARYASTAELARALSGVRSERHVSGIRLRSDALPDAKLDAAEAPPKAAPTAESLAPSDPELEERPTSRMSRPGVDVAPAEEAELDVLVEIELTPPEPSALEANAAQASHAPELAPAVAGPIEVHARTSAQRVAGVAWITLAALLACAVSYLATRFLYVPVRVVVAAQPAASTRVAATPDPAPLLEPVAAAPSEALVLPEPALRLEVPPPRAPARVRAKPAPNDVLLELPEPALLDPFAAEPLLRVTPREPRPRRPPYARASRAPQPPPPPSPPVLRLRRSD